MADTTPRTSGTELPDGASILEIGPQATDGLESVAEMHMELLHFGPMAGLGKSFVREVCYRALLKAGVLQVAILEFRGEPAGFVAYTANSYDFHRKGMSSSWKTAAWELFKAVVTGLHKLGKIVRALRVVLSRRGETQVEPGANGEVVCVAVRPAFLQPKFVRANGLRASEVLIRYAADKLDQAGVAEMRMLVDADNKPVLFLYHLLGARFEDYQQAGEPMVQVWFSVRKLLGNEGSG